MNCHRAILVSRAFHKLGYEVIHLMQDGHNITQSDLEEQMPGSDNIQLDLFRNREELINDAYRERNRKIGWRIDAQEEGE